MGFCALGLLSWDDVFSVDVLYREGSVAAVILRAPHADTDCSSCLEIKMHSN